MLKAQGAGHPRRPGEHIRVAGGACGVRLRPRDPTPSIQPQFGAPSCRACRSHGARTRAGAPSRDSSMANKMLIDATHPEETRVVVLRGNRVEEFDFESANRKQLRGNIYLAKVTRVEPSLQAAFVDYGGNRHGFLAFSEIHPDYYQIPVADRQALIADEERAHRDAEDEIDRRAQPAAAAPRPQPRRDASAAHARRRRSRATTRAAEAIGARTQPRIRPANTPMDEPLPASADDAGRATPQPRRAAASRTPKTRRSAETANPPSAAPRPHADGAAARRAPSTRPSARRPTPRRSADEHERRRLTPTADRAGERPPTADDGETTSPRSRSRPRPRTSEESRRVGRRRRRDGRGAGARAALSPPLQDPGSHQAPADHAGAGGQGRARHQGRGADHLSLARRPLFGADAEHRARRRHQPQDHQRRRPQEAEGDRRRTSKCRRAWA